MNQDDTIMSIIISYDSSCMTYDCLPIVISMECANYIWMENHSLVFEGRFINLLYQVIEYYRKDLISHLLCDIEVMVINVHNQYYSNSNNGV